MKRINLVYDGQQYSVSGRDPADVMAEIASAVASGIPQWLTVNQGGGLPQEAHLLLSPGVSVAVLPIPNPDVDPDAETDRSRTQA